MYSNGVACVHKCFMIVVSRSLCFPWIGSQSSRYDQEMPGFRHCNQLLWEPVFHLTLEGRGMGCKERRLSRMLRDRRLVGEGLAQSQTCKSLF